MSERTVTRPGLETPAEGSAWDASRQNVMISLRPIGAPTSIGLYGLAAASLVLAGLHLGWVAPAESKNVAVVLLGLAFLAQLVAGVLGFFGRDGTMGTAMVVLALTWLVIGVVLYRSAPGATSDVLGLFLISSGTTMLLVAIAASTSKLVPAGVFVLAAIRLLVAAGYELSSSEVWERISGVLGLVLFPVALYAAFAAGLEEALGRTCSRWVDAARARLRCAAVCSSRSRTSPWNRGSGRSSDPRRRYLVVTHERGCCGDRQDR